MHVFTYIVETHACNISTFDTTWRCIYVHKDEKRRSLEHYSRKPRSTILRKIGRVIFGLIFLRREWKAIRLRFKHHYAGWIRKWMNVLVREGRGQEERNLSRTKAKGAMTMVATTWRYVARMKLLMPCFKETMEIMYIPAYPNCRETIARYGFTLFSVLDKAAHGVWSPMFLSLSLCFPLSTYS